MLKFGFKLARGGEKIIMRKANLTKQDKSETLFFSSPYIHVQPSITNWHEVWQEEESHTAELQIKRIENTWALLVSCRSTFKTLGKPLCRHLLESVLHLLSRIVRQGCDWPSTHSSDTVFLNLVFQKFRVVLHLT